MRIILNRYIRKMILLNIMIIFVILISLSSIIRLIDELRKIGEQHHSFFGIIFYLFLSLPKDFELFLPIVTLLGGLLGLGIFEIHNEFVIMQIFGISKLKIAISVIKASVPVLLFSLISSEWILPYSDRGLCMYQKHIQHDTYLIPKKSDSVWLMDSNYFVCIERILTYDKLLGVTLYHFDENKKLRRILFIECALFDANNIWNLLNVNELSFSQEKYISHKQISQMEWNSLLTPCMLSVLIKNPSVLSISQLYCCIKYLNQVGQNSNYYQLIFWNKILSPFSGCTMLILAFACSFGLLYQKKVSFRLFIGAIIGFMFYILNQVFKTLSITYIISPIIGSALSTVILLIISVIIIWRYC